MDTFWNLEFSQLLRNTQPYYWGNWTLDAQIQPGPSARSTSPPDPSSSWPPSPT